MATLKNLTINDTGFIQVATGTTGERSTPVNGDLRTNTTTSKVEMYSNGVWVTVDGTVSNAGGATGGTVSTVGGYRIHTFTTTGAANFTAPYTGRVEVLVVAGGGGGAGIGGGGGAGGYIYNSNFPVVGGVAYPTVVGTGGTGPAGHGPAGGQGTNSSFGSIVVLGGSGGCPYSIGVKTANGGSGGGGPGGLGTPGTNYTSYPGEHPGSNGTPGQGHPGGYGHHGSGPGFPNPGGTGGGANHGGGGGGGAGSKGVSRFSNQADAAGGRGIASTITGSSVIYAAGGGGGGHDQIYAWGPSSGGAGDGTGQAGRFPGNVQATAGGTNRGGGGGGASHPAPDSSGPGGPGIVVVRYKY